MANTACRLCLTWDLKPGAAFAAVHGVRQVHSKLTAGSRVPKLTTPSPCAVRAADFAVVSYWPKRFISLYLVYAE